MKFINKCRDLFYYTIAGTFLLTSGASAQRESIGDLASGYTEQSNNLLVTALAFAALVGVITVALGIGNLYKAANRSDISYGKAFSQIFGGVALVGLSAFIEIGGASLLGDGGADAVDLGL